MGNTVRLSINTIRPVAVKLPMRSFLIVERQIPFHAFVGRHAPPQPFKRDVSTAAACTVHADMDAVIFQQPSESRLRYRVRAFCIASMQQSVVSILDSRPASTWRLAQVLTHHRCSKPRVNELSSRIKTLPCFQAYPRDVHVDTDQQRPNDHPEGHSETTQSSSGGSPGMCD